MIALVGTGRDFHPYGPSHWAVLAVTALGAVGLIGLTRYAPESRSRLLCRALAITIALLNLSIEIWLFRPSDPLQTLPLQLSDLAPYLAAIALWTRRRWARTLTAYWCLTLSTQALFTPVLRGPDFPSPSFVVFFADHTLVVWAAIMLVWGLRLRPGWTDYRLAVAVTTAWAAIMIAFNAIAGTNYAYLNAKPRTPSLLDALGPWPWYLLSEAALVVVVWAGLTFAWQPRTATASSRRSSSQWLGRPVDGRPVPLRPYGGRRPAPRWRRR